MRTARRRKPQCTRFARCVRIVAVLARLWSGRASFSHARPACLRLPQSRTSSVADGAEPPQGGHRAGAHERNRGLHRRSSDSMTGVPATPDMHFRNGAMAFTYMATLLLETRRPEKGEADTKLSAYFPGLPSADRITLRNLAQMTSATPITCISPKRRWPSTETLFASGLPKNYADRRVKPMQFVPAPTGLLAHELRHPWPRAQKIAGMPLVDAIRQYVLEPMGLKQTGALTTPEIPQPVLHAFSSERREVLGVKTRRAVLRGGDILESVVDHCRRRRRDDRYLRPRRVD